MSPFLLRLLGALMIRSPHINRVIVDRSVPHRAINPKVGNVSCEINPATVSYVEPKLFQETTGVLNPLYEYHFINSLSVYDYCNNIILKFIDIILRM